MPRYSNQHGRARIARHIAQTDPVRPFELPIAHCCARLRKGRLKIQDSRHCVDQQALAIDHVEARFGLVLGQTLGQHRPQKQRADSDPRRASSQDCDAMLAQRHARHIDGREQCARGDDRGALDVVIEGAKAMPVSVQQSGCIVAREILPLQQYVRPPLRHRAHEGLDELVIVVPAHALMPPAHVKRVGKALSIIGPHIEHDRQGGGRMQPATRRVERKLANGDTHSSRALIAQPQDPLAVSDDNGVHVIEARIGQDPLDPVLVRDAQKQPTRLAECLAEFLTALPYHRGVDHRQHAREIADQYGIEKSFVAVLKPAQKDVARKIAGQLAERLHAPVDLLVEIGDVGRQQPVQIERIALLLGERRPLVQ